MTHGARKITIDGREYASVDDMPPDVRRLYELAMRQLPGTGGGVPVLSPTDIRTSVQTTIVVNGQTYESLDEVPTEVRAAVEQAMGGKPRGAILQFPGASKPTLSFHLGQPIEPTAGGVAGGLLRVLVVVAVLVGMALAAWGWLGGK